MRRGKKLREIGHAHEFEDPWRHVDEFQDARALFDGRYLETNERSQAGAIKVTHVTQIDDHANALWEGAFTVRKNYEGTRDTS